MKIHETHKMVQHRLAAEYSAVLSSCDMGNREQNVAKLEQIISGMLASAILTIAGLFAFISLGTIDLPGQKVFSWVALPVAGVAYAIGHGTNSGWLEIFLGFALWTYLFAVLFSSRCGARFKKSLPI